MSVHAWERIVKQVEQESNRVKIAELMRSWRSRPKRREDASAFCKTDKQLTHEGHYAQAGYDSHLLQQTSDQRPDVELPPIGASHEPKVDTTSDSQRMERNRELPAKGSSDGAALRA